MDVAPRAAPRKPPAREEQVRKLGESKPSVAVRDARRAGQQGRRRGLAAPLQHAAIPSTAAHLARGVRRRRDHSSRHRRARAERARRRARVVGLVASSASWPSSALPRSLKTRHDGSAASYGSSGARTCARIFAGAPNARPRGRGERPDRVSAVAAWITPLSGGPSARRSRPRCAGRRASRARQAASSAAAGSGSGATAADDDAASINDASTLSTTTTTTTTTTRRPRRAPRPAARREGAAAARRRAVDARDQGRRRRVRRAHLGRQRAGRRRASRW